jgi:anti-anti-sigma factor
MTTVDQQDVDGVRLVRVHGSMTQADVDDLEPMFDAALPDGSRAVVDLGDVDLITTPGLSLIISATQRLRKTHGKVVFTAAHGIVLDLIKRCRLDEVLDVERDPKQAVEKARH